MPTRALSLATIIGSDGALNLADVAGLHTVAGTGSYTDLINKPTIPSDALTFTGDASGSGTTGTTTSLTLANSGVTAGSYGSATNIPAITVDNKGRITSVTNTAVSIPSGSLTFTGDVTGSGTTGSSTSLTLASVGTAGTYTKVTTDAKGRVTSGTTLSSSDIPSLSYLPLTGGTLTGTITTTAAGSRLGNLLVGNGTYKNSITPIDDTNMNLDTPSGAVFATTSFRAPIFYDSNNTSFYLDPASTSALNNLYNTGTRYQTYHYERSFDLGYFTNGIPNLCVDLILINGSINGTIELEINSTYSYQNSVGSYVVRIDFGANANNSVWQAPTRRQVHASGPLVSNIYIGNLEWDSTNSYYKIPIYHLTSTGNSYALRVRTFGLEANYLLNASISSHYTRAASGVDHTIYQTYTVSSGSDVRAPIFYDSDDTAYYLNPRSASRMSGLRLDGVDNEASGADAILWINKPNNNDWAMIVSGGLEYGLRLSMAASHSYAIQALANGTEYSRLGSDLFYHNSNIRAPIFYDNNDTNYYLDPAGTSSLNTVRFNSGATAGPYFYYGNNERNLYLRGGGAGTDVGLSIFDGAGNWRMQLYGNSGNYGFLNGNWGGWDLRKTTSGNLYMNNTETYYLRTDGMSSMYGIAIRGDQASTNTSNQIFFWDSGNTTTSAIGFKSNGAPFTNPTGNGDGYNTYLTMDTDGRGWVFSNRTTNFVTVYTSGWILNNGLWQANASMRAPIFYDSNNTAYYADLSSTGDSIRAAGNIIAYYSDDRLKTKLGNITDALKKVNQLNGFYYQANELAQNLGYKPTMEVGVSAQEVEQVLPQIVKPAPIDQQYKTVDYSRLVPLLIEAVKELSQKLSKLEAKYGITS